MDFGRVSEAFTRARQLGAGARRAFLESLEPALRAEVQDLLGHHEASDAPDLEPSFGAAAGPIWAAATRGPPPELDEFTIVGRLGAGGMGTVYEAQQHRPRRRVAIKVLHLPTDEGRRRFAREAQALARLDHPGIARIHAQGLAETPTGPCPYLVMEMVDGVPLHEYARPLDRRAKVELLLRVCAAVAHAHERGVIHRDLKPGNILVTAAGEPKVLDFGLARDVDGDTFRTRTGHVLGTLAYMSPEQALGDPGAVDTRCDVYALGAIAYELLAGHLPLALEGLTLPAGGEVLRDREPALLPGRGDLPVIVAKALAKERGRRYASASALAEDLQRFLDDEPVLARPPTTGYQIGKFVRRHRAAVGGVLATFLALAVGLVVAIRFAYDAAREERRARHAAALASLQAGCAAWRAGDWHGLRRQLDAVAPDERGWEWRFLENETDLSAQVLSTPSARLDAGFCLDASSVLVQDPRNRVHLVDTVTGGTRTLADPVASVAATYPAGMPLALAERDGRLHVVNVADGRTWTGPAVAGRRYFRRAAVSPDGTRLVWARDDRLHCHALDRHQELWSVACPTAQAIAIAGGLVAAGGKDRFLRIFDLVDGRLRVVVPTHTQDVTCVAIDPRAATVATGSFDRSVYLHDIATGTGRRLHGHIATVRALAFAPDGRMLASGASDRAIRVWDVASGACERILYGHEFGVLGVAFDADAEQLVSVGVTSVRRWAVAGGPVLRVHAGVEEGNPSPYVYGVAFRPDGVHVASCGWDETVRIVDTITRRAVSVLRCAGPVRAVAYSPDGTRIAAGAGSLEIWDARTGARAARIPGAPGCHRLVFTPDGTRIVAASAHAVVLLDARSGAELARWAHGNTQYERVAVSPDASRLAHALPRGDIVVRRVRDGAIVRRLRSQQRAVHALAFSPDGRRLASASADIRVWDVRSGRMLSVLRGHVGQVYAVVFGRDGARLVSAGQDGTIRVWEHATGDERLVLRGHQRYVFDLAFSPDGGTLASASGDNTVRVWSTDPESTRALEAAEIRRHEAACEGRVRAWLVGGADAALARIDAEAGWNETARRAARNVLLREGTAE